MKFILGFCLAFITGSLLGQESEVDYQDIFFQKAKTPKAAKLKDISKNPLKKNEIKLFQRSYETQSELEIIQDTEELKVGGMKMGGGLVGAYAFGKVRDYTPSNRAIHLLDSTGLSTRKKGKALALMGSARKYSVIPQLASKYFIIEGYIQTTVALKGRRATEHPAIAFTLKTANECQFLFDSPQVQSNDLKSLNFSRENFMKSESQDLQVEQLELEGTCEEDVQEITKLKPINQNTRYQLLKDSTLEDESENRIPTKVQSK